ncbi:MAG: Zinc-regulated outer membrane receptor, partial [uncultured Sphingomonadaceae bacterium]
GGFVLSREARAAAVASGDPDIADLAELRGKLPNSAQRTWEAAGGLALVRDNGSFGVSLARYDSLYGIPIRYALTPGGEAEAVRLDVRQWRGDLRGEIDIASGFAERLLIRGGYADYRHDELEESGEIGTSFFNDGGEMRVELAQRRQGAWGGTIGAQYLFRDFRAEGEEKFVPPTRTRQASLFTLQTFDFDPLVVEGGLRVERANVDADADEDLGTDTFRRRFTAVSGSLGAGFKLGERLRVGLNLTRVERAPSAEELYSNGPHAGTQSFEIGDPTFRKERSTGAELTLRGNGEGYSFDASAYYNRYSNFIYQRQTGEVEDDLPVFLYQQGRATQRGFEVEGRARLVRRGTAGLWLTGLADYTRINIRDSGPAPLVPPLRFIGGVEYVAEALTGGVEVERSTRQNRNAPGETETPGFTLVNASLAFRPFGPDGFVTFNLSANNIFDVEARRHSSLLKDFAPLSGRDIRVGAHVRF